MRKKIIGIYKITNLINDMVYIGQAVDIYARQCRHFSMLKRNVHTNKHLQSAYNLYGKDNFVFSILETFDILDVSLLTEREQYYSNLYNAEQKYNFRESVNSNIGLKRPHNTDTKNKIRYSKLGKPRDEETKIKISKTLSGHTGHKHTVEHKNSLSGNQRRSKSVLQIDINNIIISSFTSILEASKHTNTSSTNIVRVCKGKQKTAGGYKWRYA
jgi:group I intron endonuclease